MELFGIATRQLSNAAKCQHRAIVSQQRRARAPGVSVTVGVLIIRKESLLSLKYDAVSICVPCVCYILKY